MKINSKQNIPEGWQQKDFLDCIVLPSKLSGVKKSEYKTIGKFSIFDQGQNYISGYADSDALVNYKYPAILFGDHTRIVKMINEPFVLGADGTKVFWPQSNLDPIFLYFVIANVKVPSTGYNRHFKFLKNARLLIPPLLEQKKIAEILSSVDENIQVTQKNIDQIEHVKKGLMQDLFTKGIGHTKFKDSELGKIPESWGTSQIQEVADFIDYRGRTPKKTDKGIPLITAKNVRFGYVNLEPREFIAEEDYKNWMTRGIPNKGDVLFTTEAPLGFVAQIDTDKKIALAQRIITLQGKNIDNTFLKYLLLSENIQKNIRSQATGGTVQGIKASVLKKIYLCIPPPAEQKQITMVLSTIDRKITVYKKKKAKLERIKKGLMQDLLSGQVRVV